MKLRFWVSILALVALLPIVAQATGNGDVTIKFNGGLLPDSASVPQVWKGKVNIIEIWITNDAPLYGFSIALSFDMGGLPFHFGTPYGFLPYEEPYLQPHGALGDLFNPDSVQIATELLPNTLLIQGRTSTQPLVAHTTSTLCYSLALHADCGVANHGKLRIDNIYLAPGGTWMFDDGTQYAPTFQGQSNTSMTIPDAPAVVFGVGVLPCESPYFTVTPGTSVNVSHCSAFQFTFGAEEAEECASGSIVYSSSVGDMDSATGQFVLSSGACGTSTAVTAFVTNGYCLTDDFSFTVNWIDSPVTFINCPTTTAQAVPNEVFQYRLVATDPDLCDTAISFALTPVGTPPEGEFGTTTNGTFTFTPTSADSGHTYVFDMAASSGCPPGVNCQFAVRVGTPLYGDANGDGGVNISDAVFLIAYIFAGGQQPIPLAVGDADCNTAVNISDAVYLIAYIFSSGSVPGSTCH